MCTETPDEPRAIAIEQLRDLGLSAYAARTFVALTALDEGTAQDVSDVAEVPRTRVYDAVTELQELGLVDVQHASPRRFTAVSAETAGRLFDRTYTERVNRLRTALDAIAGDRGIGEQRGVYTVDGTARIDDRVHEFITEASDEIVYMTVGDLLADGTVDALRAASDRGVDIRLAGMADGVTDDLRTAVPHAEWFESLWDWSDTPAGRLLMVDQGRTLVSVLPADDLETAPDRTETAVWGSGRTNSLVVVLRALFTWQLDGER